MSGITRSFLLSVRAEWVRSIALTIPGLDREVAIKLLPADFANDADRLRRFEQEAKATSALNHPNILTVYDIGEHEARLLSFLNCSMARSSVIVWTKHQSHCER